MEKGTIVPMLFRKAISTVVLLALLTWSMSALCTPVSMEHGAACVKMAYRTVVVQHPRVMASHKCCPPAEMIVIVCYRMHGDGDCDTMRSCMPFGGDQAISGTARYHDDGLARACAHAHVTNLLKPDVPFFGAPWERAAISNERPVLDSKADLRI